jgi:FkbM family methyltransferase
MPTEGLIYDIGMHRGEDTALYLAMDFHVVAFEADPDHCAYARQRFAGKIASGHLNLVEGAIAPGHGTVTFYRHAKLTEWGTINRDWVARNDALGASTAMRVPVVDLAAQIAETGVPYYVKIDIEGTDRHCLEVLRGFNDRAPYLSIESTKTDWRELNREFDLLEELGYNRFCVVQQANIPGSLLSTTTLEGQPLHYHMEPGTSGRFGRDLTRWETRRAALRRYRAIFVLYHLLGDHAVLRRSKLGRRLIESVEARARTPLPGWYDTHARHRTAEGSGT